MSIELIEYKPKKPVVIDYATMGFEEISHIMYEELKPKDEVKVIGPDGNVLANGIFVGSIHDSIYIEIKKEK